MSKDNNPPPAHHKTGNGARIAASIEACDWSGSPIGNKEIIKAAVAELRSLQAWQHGALSCREAEQSRVDEYKRELEDALCAQDLATREQTAAFTVTLERAERAEAVIRDNWCGQFWRGVTRQEADEVRAVLNPSPQTKTVCPPTPNTTSNQRSE